MGEGRLEGRDAPGTRIDQKLFAVEGSRSLDLNLQVMTDEGDTVTLSVHRETEFSALSYRIKSRGEEGRQSFSLRERSVSVTQDFSVQVEGSLSDQELADIEQLVQRISGSLANAGRGGLLTSTPDGAQPGEFDSLAGYTLDVSRTQTLDMTAVRSREWRAPVAAPVAPEREQETPAPAQEPAVDLLDERRPVHQPQGRTCGTAEPKPIAAWLMELLNRTREVPAEQQPICLTPDSAAA